jgi:hypothetical protein
MDVSATGNTYRSLMAPSPWALLAGMSVTGTRRTYRKEGAITPHLLYLLLTKGVTLALPDVRGGRKREENGPTTAKLDLFCAL